MKRLIIAALATLGGCPEADQAKDGDGKPVSRQEAICLDSKDGIDIDVLLVVDNSRSMAEEQASLAREIPKMVDALAKGELGSGGESRRFPAARSIHVGVVTTDMGINGVNEPSIHPCGGFGQDGLLRKVSECGASKGFLASDDSESAAPTTIAEEIACLSQVGTDGCGFEQPLEAMWKALAPEVDQSFSRGTSGHGDEENAAFLRDNSLLVVLTLTDEDDCSIPDSASDLFTIEPNPSELNVKCGKNPDRQHPIARFVNGLRSLRTDVPDRLLFAAITGVPVELEGEDYDTILKSEAMQFVAEEDSFAGVLMPRPACSTAHGIAFPARRLVKMAKELGDQALVRSICREDFGTAMTSISSAIGKSMERSVSACEKYLGTKP